MVKVKAKYIVLYLLSIILLFFGQRTFWEKILEAQKEKQAARKTAEETDQQFRKPFEVQQLQYVPAKNSWKNQSHYFQTIHVGKVDFKASRKKADTHVETHDEENASDSN